MTGLLACALVPLIAGGCTAQRPWVDRALMRAQPNSLPPRKSGEEYTVGCPDVLEIQFANQIEKSGKQEIQADGTIATPSGARLRVEGLTAGQVAASLSQLTDLPMDQVKVRVADYRSQQVYIVGQVVGLQRAVPYQGPETVLQLLQRAGGVTVGAAPNEVYVVRSRIAEGRQPELFRVRLRDILTRQDNSTNIYLQPQDQIFVGETARSTMSRYVPPWLKPMYEAFWGMRRPDGAPTAPS